MRKLKSKGEKAAFPTSLKPMLATLIKEPFDDPDWLYEVKWDGYRILAKLNAGSITLHTRELQNYTTRYGPVVQELKKIKHDVIIDGEMVVIDEHGKPFFNGIQNYRPGDPIIFYVFDLLWLDGNSLIELPLEDRKTLLEKLVPKSDIIRYSESFSNGMDLYEQMQVLEMEGIVAKRRDSIYLPDKRVRTWLKVPITQFKEYIIIGWAESGSGRAFRSLLVGEYRDGDLYYVHHSGGGFDDKQMADLLKRLKKIEIKKKPFLNDFDRDIDTPVHFTKPELVAQFKLSTKTTPSGKIRHPLIFVALREDKKPGQVTSEEIASEPAKTKTKTIAPDTGGLENTIKQKLQNGRSFYSNKDGWSVVEKKEILTREETEIEGKTIVLTNMEKTLWKGVSKDDLMYYYLSVSKYLLPFLKDRPLGINVINKHAYEEGEFIRGMQGKHPKWAQIYTTDRKHKKEGKSESIDWLVCNDLATLVYIINLESIDLHPWNSRTLSPENPDYIVIDLDLDPDDKDYQKVIQSALAAKEIFDKLKLTSFVKTSGKTGMHLYLPCAGVEFGHSRTIAENICEQIHNLIPEITTTNISTSGRSGKLYLDPNQNDYADRVAAPYCTRAGIHTPRVSTPLEWKEVNNKLDPHDFTIKTILERLQKKGDLFRDIGNAKIALKNSKILKKLL